MKYKSLLIVLATLTIGCKKYSDDSFGITLRKPEARIENKWQYEFVVVGNEDVSSDYVTHKLNFQDQGKVIREYQTVENGQELRIVEYGSYRFEDKEVFLVLNFDNNEEEYEILELNRKNLSIRSINLPEEMLVHLSAE